MSKTASSEPPMLVHTTLQRSEPRGEHHTVRTRSPALLRSRASASSTAASIPSLLPPRPTAVR
eukprot:7828067-Lingulodinium_polyedra.AAC.1